MTPGQLLASLSGAILTGTKPLHHDTVAGPRRVVVVVVVVVRGSRRTQCISTNAYELIVHPATPASEANYGELTTCMEGSSTLIMRPDIHVQLMKIMSSSSANLHAKTATRGND